MRPLILGCVVTLVGSLSLAAADDIPKPLQGTSSVTFSQDKAGNKTAHIHNLTYLYQDGIYLAPGKSAKPMAFLIEQDQTSSVPMISDTPPTSKWKAQAWVSPDGFPHKLLWSLETEGDSAAIEDRFYAVTHDGFEDSFPIHTYYRMADGKQAYLSNTPLLTVYSPEDTAVPRYIGFRSQFADNELSKALTDKKLFGIISYGDDQGVTKKIGIFGHPNDDEPSQPGAYLIYEKARIEDRVVYLRDNKETGPQAFSHFSAVILLSDGIEAEIPFENDTPQLAQARLPKGYTAELIP